LQKARAANPRVYNHHLYLAGAFGFRGDLDEARALLAMSLKLNPQINSLARWRAFVPWNTNLESEHFEKTVNVGLRRAGFPDI
jgi:hypothetical protein